MLIDITITFLFPEQNVLDPWACKSKIILLNFNNKKQYNFYSDPILVLAVKALIFIVLALEIFGFLQKYIKQTT